MKQKLLNSIRLRAMMLVAILCAGFTSAWADTKTDVLNQSWTGITGSNYSAWSNKTSSSGAVYAGNSAGDNSSIQLRSKNSNSGVVTTTSGGKVKSITVVWQSSTSSGRTLNVYGKNSAYSAATDLYNASNQGTLLGTIVCGTSTSLTINGDYEYIGFRSASGAMYLTSVSIVWETGGGSQTETCAAPTFSPAEGTYTSAQNVEISTATNGATIYYTIDGATPTTSSSLYSSAITVSETQTIKAIAVKDGMDNSAVASAAYTIVTLEHAGTQADPYTVADARTAIDANVGKTGVYATGIVSEIVTAYNSTYENITFDIIDQGGSNTLRAYRCEGAQAANVAVGDIVVVSGDLVKYGDIYEFGQGCELVSLVTKPAPTFSLDKSDATLDAYTHGTVDVTLTTNTDGLISCESSDADVATVALKSEGVYTITAQSEGSATITIRSDASANYKSASATVDITVEDARADAGISFVEDEEETTWGESYSTQTLTNTNSVAVTWSSTDETVATVNGSTGAITILKAGSTTIKATFAGDATYKAAVASYTLSINKAEAGISYSETSFDVELNDDSFVAPTLNNPNALEGITYASNNETVATVNATTGALSLVTTAEGTVKITATFAGNDNYKSGSANYTITVIDPTRKGSKLNPYTVADIEGQASATEFGNNIYVTGYIVGSVKNNKCYKGTGDLVNTNLLLADTPDISFTEGAAVASNEDGLIPVELPASPSSIRTNWGPASNAVIGYKVVLKGSAQSYFGTKGIKGTSEVSAVSVGISVGAAGYTTITTKCPTSFEGTGVTAYKATAVNPSTIHLEAIDEAPAGQALVIKASEGLYADITILPSAAEINDNLLQSSNGSVAGNGTSIYALGVGKTGVNEGVVGFYLVNNGQTIPAGKAYLTAGGASVKEFLTFDFDDATAVSEVKNEGVNSEKSIFNLAGQKMSKLQKGVNIVNGKKVLVK